MAVTASFIANTGLLNIFGDGLANTVTVSRNAAGTILINGGAVPVLGGTSTVANTGLIQAFGLGGDDNLSLDESQGALPAAHLFAGAGNDTAVGGSGADQLFGQSGNDVLLGRGGFDLLFGGSGNDTLTGGDADDQMFGEAGDDRMIWNPGDDSDLMEGGSGIDTAEVNGGNGAEIFTIAANGARVLFERTSPAPFSIDIGTTENLVVNANGGNDMISASGNLAALIQLTLDGGAGNDTILGGNGADTLLGGDGNDFVDGNQGNDVARLGAGDDTFKWDPGDGSDVVEGQDGFDTLVFNGAGADETVDISANGERVHFFRDPAAITMDLNDVERVEFHALGGSDNITVNDLGGTDVTEVAIDLAAALGGTAGDGKADSVIVDGTNGDDVAIVSSLGSQIVVSGSLSAQVTIDHADAGDKLIINGLAGDDVIDASSLGAGKIALQLFGGAGDDVIIGSAGNDTIDGGAGDDVLIGNAGNDTISGRAGDDLIFGESGNDTVIVSSPLDGHDIISGFDGNGAGGQDTLNLDALFDGLGVAAPNRASHVSIVDNGASVDVSVDADGNAANGFEFSVATLITADVVTVGQDVILGT